MKDAKEQCGKGRANPPALYYLGQPGFKKVFKKFLSLLVVLKFCNRSRGSKSRQDNPPKADPSPADRMLRMDRIIDSSFYLVDRSTILIAKRSLFKEQASLSEKQMPMFIRHKTPEINPENPCNPVRLADPPSEDYPVNKAPDNS